MIIKERIITLEDIEKLNNEENSEIILKNTKGQNAEIFEMLNSNVKVKIISGYDANINSKFNDEKYVKRTLYDAKTVAAVIRKFEDFEKNIDTNWTDLEKSLYMFIKLVNLINYDYNNESKMEPRNLSAMLTKLSRCAGYSICFKEAMDRLGIENEFRNVSNIHSFNAIKINGEWRLIDLTWAKNMRNNTLNSKSYLKHFGMFPLHKTNPITHCPPDYPKLDYKLFYKKEVLSALKTIAPALNTKTNLKDPQM